MPSHKPRPNGNGWIKPPAGGLFISSSGEVAKDRAGAGPLTLARFGAALDKAAALIHPIALVRVVLVTACAAMSTLMIPWAWVGAWLSLSLVVEVWAFVSSRRQGRGETVSWITRWNFLAAYVALNLIWVAASVTFVLAGGLSGMICALIIAVVVVCAASLVFHASPLIFMIAGAAPPMAALAAIGFADGRDWRTMLPIWSTLALTGIFTAGRARETPSAQQQQLWLRDTLTSYETLVSNVSDIIARTDENGRCLYVSPACFKVLGYTPDELIGTDLSLVFTEDQRQDILGAVSEMVQNPDRSRQITTLTRAKDGRRVWLQTNLSLHKDQMGFLTILGVSRDVTERVLTDKALLEAKAEAEAANAAKARVLANVSHEIRTPMNAILGALNLIEAETLSDEGRNLTKRAIASGKMLSQLLNDVLDFSKIEAGQLDLTPEPFDVGDALTTVTSLLGPQASAKGVALKVDVRTQGRWINADPTRVQQILFNLIGNAVKFTIQGEIQVLLVLTATEAGKARITCEVRDSGIGMSPEMTARLFTRFAQAENKDSRRFGGAGLGLSIAKAVAERMGGLIEAKSQLGHGSLFTFSFEAPLAEPSVEAEETDLPLAGVRLLIADDNATNRLVASTLLRRLGAEVEEAEDGLAALTLARREQFDLILMDIQMPHMDGLEATRAIRALPGPRGQAPIIALTANAMSHQRLACLEAGMNGVAAKPISPQALLTEIALVLQNAA